MFSETDDVFEQVKEKSKYEEENMNFEFDFTKKFNRDKIPEQLDSFNGRKNEKFNKIAKS